MTVQDQSDAMRGGFAAPPQDAAIAFRAVLQALSRPGRIETVAGAEPPAPLSVAAGVAILTLCDPETALYLAPSHDTPAVRAWITFHTGAPLTGAARADFAIGTWDSLAPYDLYRIGTPEYPDRSATVIVEQESLRAEGAILSGPGIAETAQLSLPEIATFQANRAQFPLGFDCLFTCGDRLAGLPRSTNVTEGA